MAKIVTNANGVSTSTAVPKVKTTTKSGVSGVSVGEIKGSAQPAMSTVPAVKKSANSSPTASLPKPVKPLATATTTPTKITDPKANGYTFTEGGPDDPAVLNLPENSPSRLESYVQDTHKEAQNLVQGEYYKKYETAEELVKKGILKENPYPKTYNEYLTQTKDQNQKDADYLKQQNELASANDKSQMKRTSQQAEKAISGVEATMAQGREGVVGTSKPLVVEGFRTTTNQIVGEAQNRVQAAEMQRAKAQEDLKRAQDVGDMQMAEVYQGQIASAEEQIRTSKTALVQAEQDSTNNALNIIDKLAANSDFISNLSDEQRAGLAATFKDLPPGVLDAIATTGAMKTAAEEDKAALDAKISSIDSLGKIFGQGSNMGMDQVVALGSSFGLSMDDTIGLYQAYQATRNDKTLTEEEKKIKNADALEVAKQKQRGEFTQASQNTAFLAKLYADGADPEMIAAFKSAAGITDQSDPMYQADLQYKQAQANIEAKHARGEAVTPQDQLALAEAQEKLNDLQGVYGVNGSVPAYVPTKSLEGLKVSFENGQYNISYPPDKEFQCGAFVNRVWGLAAGGSNGMPGDAEGKRKVVEKNGGILAKDVKDPLNQVKPGMAFVMPIGGKYENVWHTGIVKEVYANGTFKTIEANANGAAKTQSVGPGKPNITERILPISQMYGFANPPDGKYQQIGGQASSAKFDEFYNQGLNDLKMKPSEAKKYAQDQMKDALKNANQSGPDPVKIAQDIMAPGSNFNLDDIKQEDRPAVAAELNKLKKEALSSGDVYGAIKASAGGKDLSESARNKLDQVTFGWQQFQDLEKEMDGVFSGPISGSIKGLNPWDPQKAIVTARLKAIVPSLARGVYNEVGVLTESDIENYMATLPNTFTLESVKADLINLTKKNIKNSLVNQLKNAAAGGADVSGYDFILDDLGVESNAKKEQKLNMIKDFAYSLVGDTQQNNGKLMIPEDITGGTFDENYIDNTF